MTITSSNVRRGSTPRETKKSKALPIEDEILRRFLQKGEPIQAAGVQAAALQIAKRFCRTGEGVCQYKLRNLLDRAINTGDVLRSAVTSKGRTRNQPISQFKPA